MSKECPETGANSHFATKFDNGAKKSKDSLLRKAPPYLGHLLAILTVTFVASEEYHTKSSLDNWSNEPNKPRVQEELATLTTLSFKSLTEYLDQISKATSTPTQTLKPTPTKLPETQEGSKLSRITGYYCQKVPGFPIGDGGGFCGTTASGVLVGPGIAACGKKWELGTKLQIDGFGQVTCLDRGKLDWNQVDIFFPTNAALYTSNIPSWAQVSEVE